MPRLGEIPRLYAIADAEALAPIDLAEAVARFISAGVRWIQLRSKQLPDGELLRQAELAAERVAATGGMLWMNDRPDLARLAGCGGLHLGQGDLPPGEARAVVGDHVVIGQSTHDRAQVAAADGDEAVDVIAVGPIFATTGKADAGPVVGLELLRWARSRSCKPLVAIGGIDAPSSRDVLAAGADCVAVLGALCRGDLEDNVERLRSSC